jgi:hypothetical protein
MPSPLDIDSQATVMNELDFILGAVLTNYQ